MDKAIPRKDHKIKYRKKEIGNGEWREAVVTCIWRYDGEDICDLSDGAHLVVAFGDQWHDA